MAAIGTGKGTVDLRDFPRRRRRIWLLWRQRGNKRARGCSPWLAEADHRGAALVHINPLIEAASRRTIVPHEFVDMATFHTTEIGTMQVQVRIGGDMALMRGVAKAVLEAAEHDPSVLDREFESKHFHAAADEYKTLVESTPWSEIVESSGIAEPDIRKLGDSYMASKRVIVAWCLGITQHEHGVDTVHEIMNVLYLRGNIGREGAGPCPVRGHSNVQGNRTCGINHRPDAAFLDRLGKACGFDPPREHGLGVVAADEAMQRGPVKVFIALGGNIATGLRPTRPAVHGRGPAAELRADGPGEHHAQPQPHRARATGPDPALPRAHRQGPTGERRTGSDGRGLHGDGPHLLRDEGAGLTPAALRVLDPRRDGPSDDAGEQDAMARLRRRLRPHP